MVLRRNARGLGGFCFGVGDAAGGRVSEREVYGWCMWRQSSMPMMMYRCGAENIAANRGPPPVPKCRASRASTILRDLQCCRRPIGCQFLDDQATREFGLRWAHCSGKGSGAPLCETNIDPKHLTSFEEFLYRVFVGFFSRWFVVNMQYGDLDPILLPCTRFSISPPHREMLTLHLTTAPEPSIRTLGRPSTS